MTGIASAILCLIHASLLATAGSLVMLVFRKFITLRAGPRVTVGLWCFLLLWTALSLLWLNRENWSLELFLVENIKGIRLSVRPYMQLMLSDMRYMYPPQSGVFAEFEIVGVNRTIISWSGNVTAAIAVAFGLWVIGAVVFWLRALIPHLRLRRALKRLPASDDPELAHAIYIERSYLGITREVTAYILPGSGRDKRVFSPCVMGVRSPVLVLPEDIWAGLSPEERDAVVAHELMHVKKCDNVRNLVLLVFHSVFWFAPIFRIALRAMRRDLEFLRDRQVLGEGATGREKKVYADAILSVAERCSKGYRPALHSGMLTGSGIGFRVYLLANRQKKRILMFFAWLAGLVVVLALPLTAYIFFIFVPAFY
jgi:beta-lactamase regulating signal transducer with metallopeptidase domain